MIRFIRNIWFAQRNAFDAEQFAKNADALAGAHDLLFAENRRLRSQLDAAQQIAAEYQQLAPTRGAGGKFTKKGSAA